MNQLNLLDTEAVTTKLPIRTTLYTLVQTVGDLQNAAFEMGLFGVLALDIETTSFDPYTGQIRLIQIAVPGQPVWVIDVKALGLETAQTYLNPLFSSPVKKAIQNAKFEIKWLLHHGFDLRGPVFDTMVAEQLLTCGHHSKVGLQQLAERYLNEFVPKDNQASDWSDTLTESQLEYAARDAAILLDLRDVLIPKLAEAKLFDVAKIEFDAVFAIAQMELKGLYFDWLKVDHLTAGLETECNQALETFLAELDEALIARNGTGLERDFTGSISLNANSPSQLLKVFSLGLGIPVRSLRQNALKLIWDDHPILKPYLAWKEKQTAVSKASKLPEHKHPVTGRVHTNFWQMGADSGRMTSSDPNVQNLPRGADFRSCVTAAPGYKLVIADYSQIELRIAAELSGDAVMIKAFNDGEDLHRLTAALVNQIELGEVSKLQRQQSKAINFGLAYAMGANGLKNYAKTAYGVDMSETEAKTFRTRFFSAYSGLAAWHREIDNQPNKFYIRTRSGRRRYVPTDDQRLTLLSNTPVQGLGADVLKLALGLIYERLRGLDAYLVNCVHDEIVIEANEAIAQDVAELLSTTMVEAGERYLNQVPVLAEAGVCDSWSEK